MISYVSQLIIQRSFLFDQSLVERLELQQGVSQGCLLVTQAGDLNLELV